MYSDHALKDTGDHLPAENKPLLESSANSLIGMQPCDQQSQNANFVPNVTGSSAEDSSPDESENLNLLEDNLPSSKNQSAQRCFSVVPVSDPTNSPNTNLTHSKRLKKSYVQIYDSDSDGETAETSFSQRLIQEKLIPEKLIHENSVREKQISEKNNRKKIIDIIINSEDLDKTSEEHGTISKKPIRQAVKLTRSFSSGSLSKDSRSDSQRGSSKKIAAPNKQQVAHEPQTLLDLYKEPSTNDSEDSKTKILEDKVAKQLIFPDEVENCPSIPEHYVTVTSGYAASDRPNIIQSNYFTIQPQRPKLRKNNRLTYLKSQYYSTGTDGRRAVEFGSTDGRNVRFHSKLVLNSPEVPV